MQRAPATIEEQLILKAINEECAFENLHKRLQSILNSKEEWHRRVIEHCLKKRLQWNNCFARKLIKEAEYYEDMMRYLRKNLALFPYHLAEYVIRVMRISPFRYYCDMIFEVMRNEQPYDSIPNFSAADALRLTGIGRNEFIDIMNKCRSKKIMWKLNKSIAKELLPTQPVDFTIEPWWGVCLVNFTLEEFKKLSEEELATIDKICKEEANSFVLFDPEIIKGLLQRGLVYFDVPVYPDDRFKVSRLEGFVSNREQSYEDPIEELLYAVFVVSSENSTVAELAATLQAHLAQLQAAASFACRLGWAEKIIDPSSILHESGVPGTPKSLLGEGEDNFYSGSDGNSIQQGDVAWSENHKPASGYNRVAFVVDANITSYLMMGSVSPGLKSHAVTLYEAGKLGHASISDLCKDLGTLEGTKFEGELQEFANHAFSLRCVLECLTSGGVIAEGRESIGLASSSNVDATPVLADAEGRESIGLASSSNVDATPVLADAEGRESIGLSSSSNVDATPVLADGLEDSETKELEIASDESMQSRVFKGEMDSAEDLIVSASNDNTSPDESEEVNCLEGDPTQQIDVQNDENTVSIEGAGSERKMEKKLKKYRVDVLRCESLAALAPATLDRMFLRDYDIVVSMVPLPQSSILPGPKGPIHFGPPSYSSMTPWMKLVLYSAAGSGPLSVVLMKGQCLRVLPAPLAGCEKALIWSWDGSSVGGLGGKSEGNLVRGSILLHCLNSLLKYSAVLVLPLSRDDLDEKGNVITLDVPLPLRNFDGSPACIGEELGLDAEESLKLNSILSDLSDKINLWAIGYIRLLRLYNEREAESFSTDDEKYEWVLLSVEFGIPLFSPKLCKNICQRVVSSHLLQTDLLAEYHDAMQDLRRKLRDVCAEYQATGPTARLLYQKEQPKLKPLKSLITYASGKWNPLVGPSSPISGALSEKQRFKLANRQRSGTEVLSFDGHILRSYALSPLFEDDATRTMEESLPAGGGKADSDEADNKEVVLPGVNLLYDGTELRPFEIGACLQARQPVALIAEASAASLGSAVK